MKNIFLKIKNRKFVGRNFIDEKKVSGGFTLFVAMIVTALILSIGFSIGNIVLKEITLSSSGKESQIAFYAADSISECALYWDRKDVDGVSPIGISPFATDTPAVGPNIIKCGTGVDGVTPGLIGAFTQIYGNDAGATAAADALYATTSFYASFQDVGGDASIVACGKVTISKTPIKTTIDARGYNVGYSGDSRTGSCNLTNPRTVERGLRVYY